MKTLAIDTSNQTLAVAVVDGQEVLGQSQTMAIKNHSTALMPAIDGLMQAVGMAPKELEQIVVAKGPTVYGFAHRCHNSKNAGTNIEHPADWCF